MYEQITFGLTSAISFVTTGILAYLFTRSNSISKLLWSISFLILGLSMTFISIYGLGILSQPIVAPIDSLNPGLLAAGLLMSRAKKIGSYFLAYVLVIFFLILASSFVYGALAAPYVMLVHFPSGLVIFILPLYLALSRKVGRAAILVGVGGLLIGVAGMALATLTTSFQFLPADLVLEMLGPIFLAITILFTLGILATPAWGFDKHSH